MPAEAAAQRRWFARQAWVSGGWARDVLLEAGDDGLWRSIATGVDEAQWAGAVDLSGPVLPGLVNAHSHAFQRAIAGLTERSAGGNDDFWSWRDRMYSAANRISPEQLEAIAAFLYVELLRAGYTQVCEFHYLHNAPDGRPYADPLAMSQALVRAAQRTGIGLTLLPTLYMRAGFAATGLREDQRRFGSTPDSVLRIAEDVRGQGAANVTAGVAIHSLRAADRAAIQALHAGASPGMPIHIHIAEQRREVEDCVLEHGCSPLELLLSQVPVDARWNMVHGTQFDAAQLAKLRDTGAAIVLCPTTEANLGDGVFDLTTWMGASGNWSIGSDSHATRSWREELRLLEYSQRLQRRQRNVAASAAVSESSAAALFEGALRGGTAAAGVPLGGLAVGQRADFMVIDADELSLIGVPESHLLDALVFSSPEMPVSAVYVAGHQTITDVRSLADGMRHAMRALWPAR